MSNNKTIKLPTLPKKGTVQITVSSSYHSRLMATYGILSSNMGEESLHKVLKAITDQNTSELSEKETQDAVCLETIVIMLKSIEEKFQSEGLIVMKDVEIPSED